jgi:uncharacterized protein with PQ loop repeat
MISDNESIFSSLNHMERTMKHPGPPVCCPCDDDDEFEWVASVAVTLNIIAMLPQVWHVYRKQNAKSLSYMWLGTSFFANVLWFIFGLRKDIPALICSATFFMGAFAVLGIMKYMFER